MNRTVLTIVTAASLSLAAGTLTADEQKGDSGNHSGIPEAADGTSAIPGEMADEGAGGFNDLDKNGDGELDDKELSTYGSTAAGPDPGSDTNGKQQMEQHGQHMDAEQLMEQYDKNNSGTLDKDEWAGHKSEMKNK